MWLSIYRTRCLLTINSSCICAVRTGTNSSQPVLLMANAWHEMPPPSLIFRLKMIPMSPTTAGARRNASEKLKNPPLSRIQSQAAYFWAAASTAASKEWWKVVYFQPANERALRGNAASRTLPRYPAPLASRASHARRRDLAPQALPCPRISRRCSDRSEPWPRPGPTRKSPSSSSPRARSTRSAAV